MCMHACQHACTHAGRGQRVLFQAALDLVSRKLYYFRLSLAYRCIPGRPGLVSSPKVETPADMHVRGAGPRAYYLLVTDGPA